MELRTYAAAGQTRLDVLTTDCRVKVGHILVVSRGLPNQELITVSGFGSILSREALQFFHAAGETVELPELLPPRDRAKLIGWLMALPFFFAFLVVSTFPLLDHNSTRIAFAVYAALAAALAALFYFLLPETLGLSFDSV